MKKLLSILILFVLLSVAVPTVPASAAQVQAYPAELAYYDAQIDLMIPHLDDFQYSYYVTNGRYYQALQSHTSAPDVPTVPDGINSSPTDQPEDLALFWDVYAALPDQLAWAFRIDTYSGPDGDGYVVTIETVIDGNLWTRSVNYGPDTWRASDWYQYSEEI